MGLNLGSLFSKAKSAVGKVVSKIAKPAGPNSGFSNVYNTLKSAVTGGGVTANTKSKTLNKVLGTVASHPFATAFAGGTAANIPKAVKAVKAAKSAKTVAPKVTNGLLQPAQTPGLLDLSTLGRTSITPTAATGGVLTTSQALGQTSLPSASTSPRKSTRRKSSRRKKTGKRSRKKRYGTAKQYARKGGKSVKYTKNGQPYIILANGRARFVKGRRKKR